MALNLITKKIDFELKKKVKNQSGTLTLKFEK